jgi:IS4 transposase
MDKAYNDYKMFSDWTIKGIYFVTRLKENAQYEVIRTETATMYENILIDEIILLTEQKKCKHQLRKIDVYDPKKKRTIVLLTNNLELDALTISVIYKDRWEIELFFKLIKQNLKIKTFVGTTENALKTQIWTAMISLLLIKWLHFLSKAKWSFSNLFSMLRMSLFTHKPLMEWIHNPFDTPPDAPNPVQINLF